MQGSITLNELGIFIVFALIVVAVGFAIVTLKNINGLGQRSRNHSEKKQRSF